MPHDGTAVPHTLTSDCFLMIMATGTSLIVRVTSALSEFDAYRQASASFAVDPSCGVGLCG